jgi:hypothetical protein
MSTPPPTKQAKFVLETVATGGGVYRCHLRLILLCRTAQASVQVLLSLYP